MCQLRETVTGQGNTLLPAPSSQSLGVFLAAGLKANADWHIWKGHSSYVVGAQQMPLGLCEDTAGPAFALRIVS